MIRITCPICKNSLEVNENLAFNIFCKSCSSSVLVPGRLAAGNSNDGIQVMPDSHSPSGGHDRQTSITSQRLAQTQEPREPRDMRPNDPIPVPQGAVLPHSLEDMVHQLGGVQEVFRFSIANVITQIIGCILATLLA